MRSILIFAVACAGLCAQPWSGIIDPARAVDWSSPGVTGGIPTNRTQCGSTIAAYTGTPGTINTAVSGCAAGHFVQLAAGTFTLSAGIVFNSKNNVTLRGMGADQTFIVVNGDDSCQGTFASICVESSDVNWKNGPSNGPVTWSAGYSKGTTVITLASVPNLKIGNPIILDQLDLPGTGQSISTDDLVVCSSTTNPICSLQGNGGGAQRAGRNQVQIVKVAGCNGSTTAGVSCSGTNVAVMITPGLYMPNWSSGQTPEAWWATNPITGVGVENLSVDHTGNTSGVGVEFFNAVDSWVKGVRSINSRLAHVEGQYAARITVRDSYFFLTQNSIDRSYAFHCYTGSDNLIENNIFQAVSGPITINGACSGTVVGYNFDILDYYTASAGFINAMSNVHTAGADSVLYEGNHGAQIYGDLFHGTHNLVTVFRNYLPGTFPTCYSSGSTYATATFAPCSSNRIPIVLHSYSRFFNVVGNVLGQTSVQTSYAGSSPIYDLDGGATSGGVTVANDTGVTASLMRWGNYDIVTGAVRWCGNSSDTGWSTTCASTSEVPSGIAHLPNAVPSTETLPASFYLGAKPSWWPSAKPWPPIGPDVTGGNLTGVAGHANTIPAEDCAFNVMSMPTNGTGPVLSFNSDACYAGTTIPTSVISGPTKVTGPVVVR